MADIKSLAGGPPVDVFYMSAVDGVTITGNGTPAHPLVATGSAPLVDGVSITGNGTPGNPLVATGLPGVGADIVQDFNAGTGDQQLVMLAGKSTLRVTGSDELLVIVGITPPADLPDGAVITFQNDGADLITLRSNQVGVLGTRFLFRAPDGNGYGINGDAGFAGGGSVQLVYRAGSGWNILVSSGMPS